MAGFGLLVSDSVNIGDYVQAIAARRYLPAVDHLVDKDRLDRADEVSPPATGPFRTILNGWFLRRPERWPPRIPGLVPLLTSMHLSPRAAPLLLGPDGREYLRRHGPVGARDTWTQSQLEAHGIPTYFSGCLTLTLERDERAPRGQFVLASEVSPRLAAVLRQRTGRPVVEVPAMYRGAAGIEERLLLGELLLHLCQRAHCVVSTRLHSVLPALAFGTPALLVEDGVRVCAATEPRRFGGLIDFVRHCREDDYLGYPRRFDLDDPPANPERHLPYRRRLEDECTAFSGFSDPRRRACSRDLADIARDPLFLASVAPRGAAAGSVATAGDVVRLAMQVAEAEEAEGEMDQTGSVAWTPLSETCSVQAAPLQ